MSLFKKKKPFIPSIIILLEARIEECKEKGEHSFYIPIENSELKEVYGWAARNNIKVISSHQCENTVYYKVYGFH